jgi:hypothetical protein
MKITTLPSASLRYASGEELLLLAVFRGGGFAGSTMKRSIDRELNRRAAVRQDAQHCARFMRRAA